MDDARIVDWLESKGFVHTPGRDPLDELIEVLPSVLGGHPFIEYDYVRQHSDYESFRAWVVNILTRGPESCSG